MEEVNFLQKLANGISRMYGLWKNSFSKNHMKKRNMKMIPDLVRNEIIEAGYVYKNGRTFFDYVWEFKDPDLTVEIVKCDENKKESLKLEMENKISEYIRSIWGDGYSFGFMGTDKRRRTIRLRLIKEFKD